ncbi:MAG: LytTR family DNA-binding domain-containing protein [Pseudomonadota bacterium]
MTAHLPTLTARIAVPGLAGLVLTVLSPLGTDSMSLFVRALFWIGLCFAGGLGAWAAERIASRSSWTPSAWMLGLMQTLGATAAVAPFVILGLDIATPAAMALSLFYIWVIAATITAVGILTGRRAAADPVATQEAGTVRPALMDRLPVGMRDAALYAVSSEDHYARIHTSAGDHLLLLRLADVPDLARPVYGLSPHRSWWVAEAGVTEVSREGGRMVLRLKDGAKVPVSRAGAKRVRDAGWLA